MTTPPICDYTDSDYQASFWDAGEREYEDRCEAIALRRLLPKSGRLLLELGAGAGRNTPRYAGFERIVLLDFSRTQLEQAQARLGQGNRYIYVAADIYRLPFVEGLFDTATMIRALHHMADAPKALRQVRAVLQPGAAFVLEYANKQNLKAILRWLLHRQDWNPFTFEPVEFAKLNFDFHPRAVQDWLKVAGFKVEKILTVSHFRVGLLKRLVPVRMLAGMDSLFQPTGALWQVTPSVFVRCRAVGRDSIPPNVGQNGILSYFKCPECGHAPLETVGRDSIPPNVGQNGILSYFKCPECGHAPLETVWRDSIPSNVGQNGILSYFKCPECGHAPLETVGRDSIPPNVGQNGILSYFKCPECEHAPLETVGRDSFPPAAGLEAKTSCLTCPSCKRKWAVRDGIYDFREPIH